MSGAGDVVALVREVGELASRVGTLTVGVERLVDKLDSVVVEQARLDGRIYALEREAKQRREEGVETRRERFSLRMAVYSALIGSAATVAAALLVWLVRQAIT